MLTTMKNSYILLAAVLLFSCNGLRSIKTAFTNVSPYEKYVESLKKAELLQASMTKEWLSAGERAFTDSIIVNLPFSESGYFQASTPEARSYRFRVREGQVLTVNGAMRTRGMQKFFWTSSSAMTTNGIASLLQTPPFPLRGNLTMTRSVC